MCQPRHAWSDQRQCFMPDSASTIADSAPICVGRGYVTGIANPKHTFDFPLSPLTQTSRLSFIPGSDIPLDGCLGSFQMFQGYVWFPLGKAAEPKAMCGEPSDVNPFSPRGGKPQKTVAQNTHLTFLFLELFIL